MSFIVFVALFVALCGWLDARVAGKQTLREISETQEEK